MSFILKLFPNVIECVLIFLPWKQRKYKTHNYNNLAHLPIIIPSKTRATKCTNFTSATKNATTNTTNTTTKTTIKTTIATSSSIRTTINNNGIETAPSLFLPDGSIATTMFTTTLAAVEKLKSMDQHDDSNGNDICCDHEDNGNGMNYNRNKNEIRITENPLPETVVC